MTVESLVTRSWYGRAGWTNIFRPIQPFVRAIVDRKRNQFLTKEKASYRAPVPVIVVGNISVGGTGKSPMVVALCELLIEQGYHPGIVSRGHGVTLTQPMNVQPNSPANLVGDEPVMLARRTKCPLVVFPKRAEAVKQLLADFNVDVVICDDGMQHYGLDRDIEIAMLDANRGVGNGHLLPVGPLREPVSRLSEVDFVVSIANSMTEKLNTLELPITLTTLVSSDLISLNGTTRSNCQQAFKDESFRHIMAGIGNPQRFINTLHDLGLQTKNTTYRWFSDHHAFLASDIPKNNAVIMTEKDAVKCQSLDIENENVWYLPVSMVLPDTFKKDFLDKLNLIKVDNQNE